MVKNHVFKQHSFAGGYVSPEILSRSDQQKYASGLRSMQNVQIAREGGAESRPGTLYDDIVQTVDNSVAWVNGNTYWPGNTVLSGGIVYECLTQNLDSMVAPGADPTNWTPVPVNAPVKMLKFVFNFGESFLIVITVGNIRIYKDGQQIQVPTGNISIWTNAVAYQVGDLVNVAGAYYICRKPNTNVNPTGNPLQWKPVTPVSGLIPLDIPLNWSDNTLFGSFLAISTASLSAIQADNLNDIMTIVSQDFSPIELIRFSDYAWEVSHPTNGPALAAMTGVTATAGTAGSATYAYAVTVVAQSDKSESLVSNTATITSAVPTTTAPNVVHWSAVPGASKYNVYGIINGVPGLLGSSVITSYNDIGSQPNFTIQPPVELIAPDGGVLFDKPGNWPATVVYFQNRIWYANTINLPSTYLASRLGSYNNFTVSTPVVDTDAIQSTLPSVLPIVAMRDIQKLIIHTADAEYLLNGNNYDALTPAANNPAKQGSKGCALPPPVTIGNTDIFVQSRGTQLHDLLFDVQSFTYTGKDLTSFATQLFRDATFIDMAWQQVPNSIIWCVMSNGQLYGMTYIQKQDIWSWHPHSFYNNALVENVVSLPNSSQDTVYLIVNRGGVRHLEELANRNYIDTVLLSDVVASDSSSIFDGHITADPVTTSTSGGWTTADLINLTSSAAPFAANDVLGQHNNQVVLQQLGANGLVQDQVTFSIINYISATHVQGYPLRNVPTWAQAATVFPWGKAVTHFTGATQLALQPVSILGDGNVVASPLNPGYPVITVANDGSFVTPNAILVLCVGLPLQMDLQTLPIENVDGESVMGCKVSAKQVLPYFYFSRGGLYGQDQNHLFPWKQPMGANPPPFNWGYPTAPFTGIANPRITLQGSPQPTGQVWIRQVDPLPFAMSGLLIAVEIGDM